MKGKHVSTVPLGPEEFDFRRIVLAVLLRAIYYEYARDTKWILGKFSVWHQERIHLPRKSEDFKKWNGVTVGDVLAFARTKLLPTDVANALIATYPEWLSDWPFDEITDISPLFPMPFLLLPPAESGLAEIPHLAPEFGKSRRLFEFIPALPKIVPAQAARLAEMGQHYAAVKLNLSGRKSKTRGTRSNRHAEIF